MINVEDKNNAFSPKDLGFDFAFSLRKQLDPNYAYFEVN